MVNAAPALVLVSGMHRSGTSATAGALTILGAEAGSKLAPGRPENPKGFFELLPLVAVHDEILMRCGYTWDDPRPLELRSFPRSFRTEARRAILRVIDEELALDRLAIVKDPRAARLIAVWLEVFQELEMAPRFLQTVRTPDEVAASLMRRSGMCDAQARQLWLEHMLAMERDTRGSFRSFVNCSKLMEDPVAVLHRALTQLQVSSPASPASRRSDLESFLETKLLHRATDVSGVSGISSSEKSVLKDFSALEHREVGAVHKRLDGLSSPAPVAGDAIAHSSHLHLQHEERIGKIIERGGLANERVSGLEQRIEERFGQINNHLGRQDQLIDSPEFAKLSSLAEAVDAIQSRGDVEVAKLRELRAEVSALHDELEDRGERSVESMRVFANSLGARLDATEGLLHREVQEANDRRARAREVLGELRSEMKGFAQTKDLAAARGEIEGLAATASSVEDSLAGLGDAQREIRADLARAQSRLDERVDAEVSAIVKRQDSIAESLDRIELASDDQSQRIEQLHEELASSVASFDEDLDLIKGQLVEFSTRISERFEAANADFEARLDERVAAATGELTEIVAQFNSNQNAELARFLEVLPSADEVAELRGRVDALNAVESPQIAPSVEAEVPQATDEDLPSFSPSLAPMVSIIVPAFNETAITIECLRSIAQHPPSVPFEVIVGNDCSTETDFDRVRSIVGLQVVDTTENVGFGANCNNAVRHAGGQYLYFLNNDAVVRAGSIDNLLGTFKLFPRTGVAGSKLVFPDGTTQDAGGIIWKDGSAWNYARGRSSDDPRSSYCRVVDYVAGASLMISRALFSDFGGFDALYAPAYYEDVDLCMKVASLDLEVRYQPASVVTHTEGRSYGTDVSQEGKHHQVLNAGKFFERWEGVLSEHRNSGDLPELEKERAALCRFLAICTEDPESEAARRYFVTLRQLSELGYKSTLYVPPGHGKVAPEEFGSLQFLGVEVIADIHSRPLIDFLDERSPEFDVVLFGDSQILACIDTVRAALPTAPILFDSSVSDATAAQEPIFEALQLCDAVLTRGQQDEALKLGVGHTEPDVLRLPDLDEAGQSHREIEADLVASVRIPRDAAASPWIEQELMALLGQQMPETHFHLVGGQPSTPSTVGSLLSHTEPSSDVEIAKLRKGTAEQLPVGLLPERLVRASQRIAEAHTGSLRLRDEIATLTKMRST